MLGAIPPPRTGWRGWRRRRPETLHAEKGYHYRRCRDARRRRDIQHRIARKGSESQEQLGQHRRVVKRVLAWLASHRRLTIRYEHLVATHRAFLNSAVPSSASTSYTGLEIHS